MSNVLKYKIGLVCFISLSTIKKQKLVRPLQQYLPVWRFRHGRPRLQSIRTCYTGHIETLFLYYFGLLLTISDCKKMFRTKIFILLFQCSLTLQMNFGHRDQVGFMIGIWMHFSFYRLENIMLSTYKG